MGGALRAAAFEELDKPPEGAYKGQIIVGGFVSLGVVQGSAINAENNFVKGSTYTFSSIETTKAVWITHLTYSFGLFGEYMPIDYIGAYSKIAFSTVVQRTDFGKDYPNKRKDLYSDVEFLVGPNFHATNRRPWDISLAPLAGIAFGDYSAIPIGKNLFSGYYPSGTKGKASLLVFGAELKFSIFFSGGFCSSLGVEWIRNGITLSSPVSPANPQTGAVYMSGGKSGDIDNFRIVFCGGYAFSN
jgi:hypothetical protein